MSKLIVKPDREPDYIDPKGGYCWFAEMLYLSGTTSEWIELVQHPKYDKLIRKDYKCRSSWCECETDEDCPGAGIGQRAEEIRRKITWDTFEKVVLGEQDEPS